MTCFGAYATLTSSSLKDLPPCVTGRRLHTEYVVDVRKIGAHVTIPVLVLVQKKWLSRILYWDLFSG